MRTRVNWGLDWVEMDNGLQQLGEAIAAALPGAITGISTDYGELSLSVEAMWHWLWPNPGGNSPLDASPRGRKSGR